MSTNIPKTSARFQTTPVSNISSGATSFVLATATDKYNKALSGLYGFSIDEGQSTEEFFIGTISGTTISSIQAMTDAADPLSSMATGLQQSHRKSSVVKITDYPMLAFLREMINSNANYTLDNVLSYTTHPTFNANTQLADKQYVDGVAVAGAPNASTSVKGIVQEATAAQINSGTATGSTGAVLTITPDQLALANLGLAAAGDNTDVAVGSGNKFTTQTGLQHNAEKYAPDTSGSSTAYVVTLSPVPTSYTNGMVVYAKMVNSNTTTTPTINVNGLGAKTIVRTTNTALAVGDIAANMFCTFIYDGTNMVLQTPTATGNPTSLNMQLNTSIFQIVSSANIRTSDSAAVNFSGNMSATKQREILFNELGGTITTSYIIGVVSGSGSGTITSQLYKNGVAVGASHSSTGTFTDTLTFATGDLIQIYVTVSSYSGTLVWSTNSFTLNYDRTLVTNYVTNTINS